MRINATRLKSGELLSDQKIYAVPEFQRSYSWDKEQITDLWEDLLHIYETTEEDYFIGSMVFTPHEKENKIKILRPMHMTQSTPKCSVWRSYICSY